MNIRCPHCQTVFRVNPERIPPSGARAKCARCGETFMITQQGVVPPQQRNPASSGTAPPDASAASPSRPSPQPAGPPAAGAARPAGAAAGTSESAPAPSRTDTGGTAAESASPLFGSKDPNQRAARIARALVSDIVAYHPDRRDKSLADGSLRQEFREEILKSWDEYVAQVGVDTAKGTPFFRDALNSILAKGERIF